MLPSASLKVTPNCFIFAANAADGLAILVNIVFMAEPATDASRPTSCRAATAATTSSSGTFSWRAVAETFRIDSPKLPIVLFVRLEAKASTSATLVAWVASIVSFRVIAAAAEP